MATSQDAVPGYVYVARMPDGRYKIGSSGDIATRLSHYRREMGAEVRLVGAVYVDKPLTHERQTQRYAYEQKGEFWRFWEWFELSDEEVAGVLQLMMSFPGQPLSESALRECNQPPAIPEDVRDAARSLASLRRPLEKACARCGEPFLAQGRGKYCRQRDCLRARKLDWWHEHRGHRPRLSQEPKEHKR